jgi:hypothetical protein
MVNFHCDEPEFVPCLLPSLEPAHLQRRHNYHQPADIDALVVSLSLSEEGDPSSPIEVSYTKEKKFPN